MPNWIVTEIEICGDKQVLEKIAGAINNINDSHGGEPSWVGDILGELGINTKKWSERAFWDYAHFNKHGHLIFMEHSAWERGKCTMALKERFPQEISGINYKYFGWY